MARTGAAARPDPKGARGVLFKGPKPGQDRRLDLPAIGPETVRGAAAAGLAGVAVEAGGVMILGGGGDGGGGGRGGAVSLGPRGRRVTQGDAPRLFLVAGEPSGDMLGAALIAGLRTLCGEGLRVEGVGGPAMAAEGLASRFPMRELSVMGLAEVLPRLPNLLRRIRETATRWRRRRRTRSSPSTAPTSRCAWRGGRRSGCRA